MQGQNQKTTSLNYHLAQAVTTFVYSAGDTIIRRIDILDAIYGIVSAMVGWKDKTKAELMKVDQDIDYMIDNYEAVIDDRENIQPKVIEKKMKYKKNIRKTYRDLMGVIYYNKLLDNSTMAKIDAGRWNNSGGDLD